MGWKAGAGWAARRRVGRRAGRRAAGRRRAGRGAGRGAKEGTGDAADGLSKEPVKHVEALVHLPQLLAVLREEEGQALATRRKVLRRLRGT